jgi:hypothetical protein
MVTSEVSNKAIFPLAMSGPAGASGVTAPFRLMPEKPVEEMKTLTRAMAVTSPLGDSNGRPKS